MANGRDLMLYLDRQLGSYVVSAYARITRLNLESVIRRSLFSGVEAIRGNDGSVRGCDILTNARLVVVPAATQGLERSNGCASRARLRDDPCVLNRFQAAVRFKNIDITAGPLRITCCARAAGLGEGGLSVVEDLF